jgi:putative FmdB family regulatory protein
MPIYAYRCETCGFAKDVLQKVSDAPLTDCPSCGKSSFKKQLTAAGFQLKGTGWYATDFRNNGSSSTTASKPAAAESSSCATEGCGAGGCAANASNTTSAA